MQCSQCGVERAAGACGGCRAFVYCGVACQDRHWRMGHRNACVPQPLGLKVRASQPGPSNKRGYDIDDDNIIGLQRIEGTGRNGELILGPLHQLTIDEARPLMNGAFVAGIDNVDDPVPINGMISEQSLRLIVAHLQGRSQAVAVDLDALSVKELGNLLASVDYFGYDAMLVEVLFAIASEFLYARTRDVLAVMRNPNLKNALNKVLYFFPDYRSACIFFQAMFYEDDTMAESVLNASWSEWLGDNARKGTRDYALKMSARQGRVDVVRLLLLYTQQADPAVQNTALQNAAANGRVEVVRLLLLHTQDAVQNTALYYAAVNGHAEVVRLLLEYFQRHGTAALLEAQVALQRSLERAHGIPLPENVLRVLEDFTVAS